jgi:RNA polymerase sigma-70 factor (ECF subfamily)
VSAADRDRTDERWSALMAAAQDGDRPAYDALLREVLPLLRAICRARLRNPSDAEDAVQDALLTLHRVRATCDPSRPFRPWLAAIAERRALDRERSHGKRLARETGLKDAASVATPARQNAEANVATSQRRWAWSELPPGQRTALSLTKIEHLPLADAATRSGISVGVLKVATHPAIRTLRRRLGLPD